MNTVLALSLPWALLVRLFEWCHFFAYALDKCSAVAGRRRIAEQTLHLLCLLGGWPGALVARQLLRHKTSKQSFIAIFWLTVTVKVSVFLVWRAGLLIF